MQTDYLHLILLKLLYTDPQLSQRELAEKMGVSLGKANYCLRALIEKGLVKLENFKHSSNKRRYVYLLTSAGIEEKTRITLGFLKQKQSEYEAIKLEIDTLQQELIHDSHVRHDAGVGAVPGWIR